MSKELKLTKEMISAEGIEIKVTQTDVIDALVEEKITSILSQYQELKDTCESIFEKIDEERMAVFHKVLKKVPAIAKVTKNFDNFLFNRSKIEYKDFIQLSCNEATNFFKFYDCKSNIIAAEEGEVWLQLLTEIDGITFSGWSAKLPYKFKLSDKLVKEIEAYSKKVVTFYEEYPDRINEKQIARSIKNQFTKEILKSSSKDFQKKLKLGFGLNLD